VTGPTIRLARPDDTAALYDVCLRTGAAGGDATGRHADPDLFGHVWAGPYLALEPEHALVLEDADGVAGYTLGALDSRAFEQRCDELWWPPLQQRVEDPPGDRATWTPDQRLAHLVHHPIRAPEPVFSTYPSHLHIDLLPRAQGGGHGRRLIETLLDLLRVDGSVGVHLGVSPANQRARGFYLATGFAELQSRPDVVLMGRDLG
jgi:ribosomal protein S18 acetylase RimI-like enzyme